MTITQQAPGHLPGTDLLPPTPAGRAARWYLGAAVPGARLPDVGEVGDWVALVAAAETAAAGWPAFFSLWQSSDWGVAEILDADSAEDAVTVAVRAVDGRIWDLTLVVDQWGRLTEDQQARRRISPLAAQ